MADPAKDAERLAAIRTKHPGDGTDRGCDYCFLVEYIDARRELREARRSAEALQADFARQLENIIDKAESMNGVCNELEKIIAAFRPADGQRPCERCKPGEGCNAPDVLRREAETFDSNVETQLDRFEEAVAAKHEIGRAAAAAILPSMRVTASGAGPRCPKHSLHTTTDGAGRYWCSVPSCTWKAAELPLGATQPSAADVEPRPTFTELTDKALWQSINVVHEGELAPSAADVERARDGLVQKVATQGLFNGPLSCPTATLVADRDAAEEARAIARFGMSPEAEQLVAAALAAARREGREAVAEYADKLAALYPANVGFDKGYTMAAKRIAAAARGAAIRARTE